MEKRVLVIEDEERMRHLLKLVLTEHGYEVTTAHDGVAGMKMWQRSRPNVVLTDLKMPKVGGLEVLAFRNRLFPRVPLIVLTAFGTIETAVEAIKAGAFEYITKPIEHEEMLKIIGKAMKVAPGWQDISGDPSERGWQMIGSSRVMHKVKQDIELVARTRSSVLITGESGSGKELVAQAIHLVSAHSNQPLIRVNCAAIPRDLLESELFGHKRGAFTGASNDRKGAFVRADGGTIFLDEVADLPLELQPKLLHAVEEKSVTPVGSGKTRIVNVKILSATNQDIATMVQNGLFRQDLFYRLNTFQIHLPPLRKRDGDIEEIANYFIGFFCREFERPLMTLSSRVVEKFLRYPWPGNVRELRNVIERAVLLCPSRKITPNLIYLPDKSKKNEDENGPIGPATRLDLADHEQLLILRALKKSHWNQSQAARTLGITRNKLRYRMSKYGIGKETGKMS